jgi:hypothetical protein
MSSKPQASAVTCRRFPHSVIARETTSPISPESPILKLIASFCIKMENDNDNSEKNSKKRRLEQLENKGYLFSNTLASLPDLLNKRQLKLEKNENAL